MAKGAVRRIASATLSALGPPEHVVQLAAHAVQQMPVEGEAVAAWQCADERRRCLGVEQHELGDVAVCDRTFGVAWSLDRNCLDERFLDPLGNLGNAFRALAAVELNEVGPNVMHDGVEKRIVGIDGERNRTRATANSLNELRRVGELRLRGLGG